MTKQIFRFAFWLLALLGLFNIFQALWLYLRRLHGAAHDAPAVPA
ncbi:hypothetical protein ABMC89_12940 [Sulfitobacter sp. HNIBRBA3233]